jgi:hypothetical protein
MPAKGAVGDALNLKRYGKVSLASIDLFQKDPS